MRIIREDFMDEINVTFGNWLYKQYLQWLSDQSEGIDKSLKSYKPNIGGYCLYLEISRAMFSQYIHHHRKPTRQVVTALAKKYGNEVYKQLGKSIPEADLQDIIDKWDGLDSNEKTKIMAIIQSK